MQEVPPIRQPIIFRYALQIGVSGLVLSLLIVAIAAPSRTSALSLSLDAGLQLPLLPQLNVTSTVSALDTPLQAHVGASISPAATVMQPKPAPIAGVGITLPPVIAASPASLAPPVGNNGPNTPDTTTPVTAQQPSTTPAQKSALKKTDTTAKKSATSTTSTPARRHDFLGLGLPNGLDFIPQTITGRDGGFRTALVILTSAAILFLGLATFTTTRLARGSPQEV